MIVRLANLVIGDWSHDGHGHTDTILVEANRSVEEISAAHSVACKLHDIPNICEFYEENTIPAALWNRLLKLGVIPEHQARAGDENEYEDVYLDSDSYAEIYINLAKLGNPSLEIEVLSIPYLNIGGYGLFGC